MLNILLLGAAANNVQAHPDTAKSSVLLLLVFLAVWAAFAAARRIGRWIAGPRDPGHPPRFMRRRGVKRL